MNFSRLAFVIFFLASTILTGQDKFVAYDNARVTIIDEVEVAASDPGIVKQAVVRHGQNVDAGELIILLDDALAQSELQASVVEREIAQMQADSDFSYSYARRSAAVNQKHLERSNRIREQFEKSITKSEIERLELEFERTKLSAKQAKLELETKKLTADLKTHQLDSAKTRLDRRRVFSPFQGTVVDVFVKPGEWVQAGQPVARVINLDRLRVKAFFPELFAGQFTCDSQCYFKFGDESNAQRIVGEIYFISPEINSENEDFEVWADIDNRDRNIMPGSTGALLIELNRVIAK